jgi:hypothetical protein
MTLDLSDPSPVVIGDILSRVGSIGYEDWWAKVTESGFCAVPVRLEAMGSNRGSEVFARCKNRRATVCPSCSQLYAGDTWQLVHAGIVGDQERAIPARHPMVFSTLTAPSFGPVHSSGALAGQPLCPDSYDYVGHVLFTWHAPALWHRFTIGLRRLVARHCRRGAGVVAGVKVSYVKVVEMQRRAIPHFHTVIRLDASDPDMTELTAPGLSVVQLAELVRQATQRVALQIQANRRAMTVRFGEQLDVTALDGVSAHKVAAYLAKYVTKSVGDFGVASRRLHEGVIDDLDVSEHVRRILRTIVELARDPQHRDLGDWLHTLGYRGHVTTKTRMYSTTLGELRARREAWKRAHQGARTDPDATTSPSGEWEWRYLGCGHATDGERFLALSAAGRHREMRQVARDVASTTDDRRR